MNTKMKKVLALFLCMTMILSCGFYSSTVDAASTKVKLTTKSITLTEGNTKTIKVKKAKNVKISKIKYVSKNKKIATITKKGKVTAKKVGKTVIYTTINYKIKKKSYSKKFKTSIVVNKKESSINTTTEIPTTTESATTTEKPNIESTTENPTTTEQPATPTIIPCNHEYGDWTITQNQTCTKYLEKYRTCNKCGYKDTYIGNTYSDHKYKKFITELATPVKDGKYQIKCTECNSIKETGTIKATGYDNCPNCNIPMTAKQYKAPTCEENGFVITTCKECGYTSNKTELLTTGHNYQTIYTSSYYKYKDISYTAKCLNCGNTVAGGLTIIPECSKHITHEFVKTKNIANNIIETKCKYCNKIEYFSANLDHINCNIQTVYNSISDVETPNVHHVIKAECIHCGYYVTSTDRLESEKHSLKLVSKNNYANEYKCSICNKTFYVKN